MVIILLAGCSGAGRDLCAAGAPPPDRLERYIRAVTSGRGTGLMPWQEPGPDPREVEFRARMEARKSELLANRTAVRHPVLLGREAAEMARLNQDTPDGRALLQRWRERADYVVSQSAGYVEGMISELTPGHEYGGTCPACVGDKTQEGTAIAFQWDHRKPDQIACPACRQTYPDPKFPETALLDAPRRAQEFRFYENERERAHPEDRSGRHAYQWIGYLPMKMSFSGIIRHKKNAFMAGSLEPLAYMYFLTGEAKYAEKAVEIFVRFAHCYRNWLYFDYYGTVADCDPLYAAWHESALPVEWKRNLHSIWFTGGGRGAHARGADTADKAAMARNFWGAGRYAASTDGMGLIYNLALAYDLIHDAKDGEGQPLWTPEKRSAVERDLFLEWLFTGEPYMGGPGRADNTNNKVPRIYHAMAAAGRVLGLPEFCEVGMKGYEVLRDRSFLYDGLSHESAGYTMMFLRETLPIIERLHGYEWPERFAHRRAMGDPLLHDAKLRQMVRAPLDHLTPKRNYLPLADTRHTGGPSAEFVEWGLKRFPEYFSAMAPALLRGSAPTAWAFFNLPPRRGGEAENIELPEIYFPAWMTALLRHGEGEQGSVAALSFSPPGNHRQRDSLTLYYMDSGERMTGDIGYVGDSPHLAWLGSTHSHTTVVVDDQEQKFRGRAARPTSAGPDADNSPAPHAPTDARVPRMEMMFTTPKVSAVEAASDVYDQCRDYRRLVVMLKGPSNRTLLVDVFRVKGGRKHDYRLWSEIATNRARESRIEFSGIALAQPDRLPDFGPSLSREHIFGLLDPHTASNTSGQWNVTWSEQGKRYRAWSLTPDTRVQVSHGSAQQTKTNPGRRARFVDVIREGDNLETTFVTVHEPAAHGADWVVRKARRIELPVTAGSDAIAVELDTAWGRYRVFSEFRSTTVVDDVRFKGKLGIIGEQPDGKSWYASAGAAVFRAVNFGFDAAPAEWSGTAASVAPRFVSATGAPRNFPPLPAGCQNWVLMHDGSYHTGFPVSRVVPAGIEIAERFPLPGSMRPEFRLPALQFVERQ